MSNKSDKIIIADPGDFKKACRAVCKQHDGIQHYFAGKDGAGRVRVGIFPKSHAGKPIIEKALAIVVGYDKHCEPQEVKI